MSPQEGVAFCSEKDVVSDMWLVINAEGTPMFLLRSTVILIGLVPLTPHVERNSLVGSLLLTTFHTKNYTLEVSTIRLHPPFQCGKSYIFLTRR